LRRAYFWTGFGRRGGPWLCTPRTRIATRSRFGNGSEPLVNTNDCTNGDPGNSFAAGNKGGDEIPSSGGVANPGGNTVD
jgi:hypothetical protein